MLNHWKKSMQIFWICSFVSFPLMVLAIILLVCAKKLVFESLYAIGKSITNSTFSTWPIYHLVNVVWMKCYWCTIDWVHHHSPWRPISTGGDGSLGVTRTNPDQDQSRIFFITNEWIYIPMSNFTHCMVLLVYRRHLIIIVLHQLMGF